MYNGASLTTQELASLGQFQGGAYGAASAGAVPKNTTPMAAGPAKNDKLASETIKEIFKKLLLLILVGCALTGSWISIGPTATIVIALSILLIGGYIAIRKRRQQRLMELAMES